MHEREELVSKARLGLMTALLDWQRSPEVEQLTAAELLAIVVEQTQSTLGTILKYQIREERHGNTDTPGGWAE